MSTSSTHHACHHPVRDVAIVALSATVSCLVAAVIVMTLDGGPLAVISGSGATFVASFTIGMTVLGHFRHV
ncbi:hypothetical protein [Streptomyces cadmiisoli]|uniref:hypothetical protein n=1 Tax=Streptomyces cadmiisoli TaxID=2184053 RepID=UPI003646B3FD